MAICPNCKTTELIKVKAGSMVKLVANAYVCPKCNTRFWEYYRDGKHSFTLKFEKGKGFVKA
jgi:hypothetical protein